MREQAREDGIETLTIEEIYEKIKSDDADFDLVISYLYSKILREEIIGSPKYGCINFHPAPLPDYRGRGGCSFAILNHETRWGCTAHYMDVGIDTGDIISVQYFPFDWKQETGISLKKKTFLEMREQYRTVLSDVSEHGRVECRKQDASEGKYYSKKDMLDAMEIRRGDDVDAKVQAFWYPPYSGAFVKLDGKKYTLVNDVILGKL